MKIQIHDLLTPDVKGGFCFTLIYFVVGVVVFVFFKTNARDVSRKQLLVANTAKGNLPADGIISFSYLFCTLSSLL